MDVCCSRRANVQHVDAPIFSARGVKFLFTCAEAEYFRKRSEQYERYSLTYRVVVILIYCK